VHGADIRPTDVPLASFTQVDMTDPAAIDAAVASIGGKVDALFNCAGIAQIKPGLEVATLNFLGIRRWTSEWLPRIRDGGAIASISSNAAMNYLSQIEPLKPFVAIEDFHSAVEWMRAHPELVRDGYTFSKNCINLWTMQQAVTLAPRRIRINCIMPGPTSTPLLDNVETLFGAGVVHAYSMPTGRAATAAEQALPLLFLNSDAANFISGVCLPVDGGFIGGVTVGAIDLQSLMAGA
jgi:NAD(P)-dependent dehydrogenase (short-subunit alcohol dehydrogenase family)